MGELKVVTGIVWKVQEEYLQVASLLLCLVPAHTTAMIKRHWRLFHHFTTPLSFIQKTLRRFGYKQIAIVT